MAEIGKKILGLHQRRMVVGYTGYREFSLFLSYHSNIISLVL